MILFQEDIFKERVYIDYHTNNKSFIKMSEVLNKLGVHNNKFFLTTYDKDLLGVDPHNLKDNSIELKLRIIEEIHNNYWYLVRNVLRVPEVGNTSGTQFVLNRFNLAMYWCTMQSIDTFNCIQRQFGKTTASIGLLAHPFYFGAEDYDIGFLSKDTTSVQEVVSRLKKIRDTHPGYLIEKQRKDGDNKEGLLYKKLNNTFRTFVAQASKLGAEKVMRSLTLPLQLMDEFSYCNNNEITFSAAVNSSIAAREQAFKNNNMTALTIITTAGDPSTKEGKYAFGIRNECMDFYDKLYDSKNKEELRQILKTNSKRSMFYISYSYKQLGKTDEWLTTTINRSGSDESKVARDLLNIWMGSTSKGGLDINLLKILTEHESEPKHVAKIDDLIFKYYITVEELEEYVHKPLVASTDGAENIEKDFSTLYVKDPKTLKTIMTMQTNIVNLNIFAKNIYDFLVFFPKCVWIPERNHVGAMIVDTVIDMMKHSKPYVNPYRRIFNYAVQDSVSSRDVKETDIVGSEKAKFGFRTTGGESGRKFLYGTVLPRGLELCKTKIQDKTLINQMKGLIRDKNGRLDHLPGDNDDMVVSFTLALFLILYGKNLEYYGINYNDLFDDTDIKETKEKTYSKEHYLDLLKKITQTEKFIKMTDSPVLKAAYEEDLKNFKSELSDMDNVTNQTTREHLMKDFNNIQNVKNKNNISDLMRFYKNKKGSNDTTSHRYL